MADARVTSIDAIVAFRGALRTFEESAAQAILSLDEQSRRAMNWIENDAATYWRQEIKRCSDLVARTRSELESCRLRTVGGQRASCLEQEQAYRAAQQKLRMAEEKIEVVRKWSNRVRRELDDYRGRTMGLRMALERDLPRTLGLLDRTISSLDSYVERSQQPDSGASAAEPSAGEAS